MQSLKVSSLCKERVPRNWHGKKILRIAKRRIFKEAPHRYQSYFVVALGDAPGYGCWLHGKDLVPLTPLEELALQIEE